MLVKRGLLLTVAVSLLAAGCGKTTSSQQQTTPPPPPPPPIQTTTPSPQTLALKVYFLRDGKIAAARRMVPSTRAVGRAALDALLAGPTPQERAAGLRTAVPAGAAVGSLSIESTVAKVDLGSLGQAAQAQVVYTLTQFPTVRSVQLGGNQLTRADLEALTPLIFVESPVVGETVTTPLRIRGTANTFEATFQVELRAGGRRIIKGTVTATSGSGTRGTFDVSIPFRVSRATDGVLIAYELSAANGRPVHVVRIPVRVEPS